MSSRSDTDGQRSMSRAWGTHVIVLPGGGYAEHTAHEGEPIVGWLNGLGVRASVFRYPLLVRHPEPLHALRAEIHRLRDGGAERIGLIGFSAGGHLAGMGEDASPELRRATSLDALVTHSSPPFLLWHTAEDPYVPPEHTYRLAASLAAHGVPHAIHVFAHGPHSLGLAHGNGDAAAWTTLAAPWITEQSHARPTRAPAEDTA
jgi:acetyl esterase/lipase